MIPHPVDILYEEGPCLAVMKPPGLLTQAPKGIDSLEVRVKSFLKCRDKKPGNIYLGVPHRLDRPASGVLLLARHVRAARRLAEQFEGRLVGKIYWALVEGLVEPDQDTWTDYIRKIPGQPRAELVAEGHSQGKLAVLDYRVLWRDFRSADEPVADVPIGGARRAADSNGPLPPPAQRDSGGEGRVRVGKFLSAAHPKRPAKTRTTTEQLDPEPYGGVTLLEITLQTGRTHQVRVQSAARGYPILGDRQYGCEMAFGPETDDWRQLAIALHARRIEFRHPMTRQSVSVVARPPDFWPAAGGAPSESTGRSDPGRDSGG